MCKFVIQNTFLCTNGLPNVLMNIRLLNQINLWLNNHEL